MDEAGKEPKELAYKKGGLYPTTAKKSNYRLIKQAQSKR